MKEIMRIVYFVMAVLFGILAYHINVIDGSSCPLFWSIVDFIFFPIPLVKWLICHQITWAIIRETFSWFFN